MRLENEKVILRDMIKSDIEDRIYWETVETEWQAWDAPWEEEDFNIENYKETALKNIKALKTSNRMRTTFQICINDENQTHIGWCNVYKIDQNYHYTKDEGFYTIGIDIPMVSARKKGYATAAWMLLIKYLEEQNIHKIYTQTWSGNFPVLGLIEKLGFKEVKREVNKRTVNKKHYDALTFLLDFKAFKHYLTTRQ